MWMPGTQLGLQPHGECCFLNTFVQLEKVRMRLPNSDPNNFRDSFGGKRAESNHGEKKRAKLNRAQFFPQGKIDIVGNVRKKSEREVDLIGASPAHTANVRIETYEKIADRIREIDRYEHSLAHAQMFECG